MVTACETCQDSWQLSWEPNYQLQRQEKRVVRVSLVRENDEVQCPGPVISLLLVSSRAKHISIIVITHVYYLEQRNHVKPQPCVSWVFSNHLNWLVAFDLIVQILPVFSVPRMIPNHTELFSWNIHKLQPMLLSWIEEEQWSFLLVKPREG